jgi:sugar lactone lactonase YvrE
MKLSKCRPDIALPGGVVRIELEGLKSLDGLAVTIGGVEAEVVGAASDFVTIRVPITTGSEVLVQAGGAQAGRSLKLGRSVAEDLHPVSSPALDSAGNIYVTYSGTRGETVPFGVFVIDPEGNKQPFLGDITNPTGLAIGPDGMIYVSSRHTGTVYRSTPDKQLDKFAEGLGIATGLAFDSRGNLWVGDRSGSIFRVTPGGEASMVCDLEPSVSAYHLAVDREDNLFVTGPTLASQDSIYRIGSDGKAVQYFKGFGRPQGLAFDPEGRLHVVASFRGRKGVYWFPVVDGEPQLRVAAPMLVGLAWDSSGRLLYLVDGSGLYRVDL